MTTSVDRPAGGNDPTPASQGRPLPADMSSSERAVRVAAHHAATVLDDELAARTRPGLADRLRRKVRGN